MAPGLLTLDLGNSRHKLRLWSSDARGEARLVAALEIEGATPDLSALERFLAGCPPGTEASYASVARPERESVPLRALAARGIHARVPPHGLELDLLEPETVGLDRLFAARGASEMVGGSALVVDLGTAFTVDALRGDERGRTFLGGAIGPGPALWARALREGTARLPEFEPSPRAPARGRSSAAALQAGLAHGLRGAIEALLDALARECALEEAPVVLTGGAAGFAAAPEARTLAGHALLREPELVHLGLWAASRT